MRIDVVLTQFNLRILNLIVMIFIKPQRIRARTFIKHCFCIWERQCGDWIPIVVDENHYTLGASLSQSKFCFPSLKSPFWNTWMCFHLRGAKHILVCYVITQFKTLSGCFGILNSNKSQFSDFLMGVQKQKNSTRLSFGSLRYWFVAMWFTSRFVAYVATIQRTCRIARTLIYSSILFGRLANYVCPVNILHCLLPWLFHSHHTGGDGALKWICRRARWHSDLALLKLQGRVA